MSQRSDTIPDGVELTPFDAAFLADPYAVYARLRTLDPVHHDRVSLYPNSWTICDHALVRQLLLDDRLSVDWRRVGIVRDPRADNPLTRRPPDLMGLDGPDHTRLRGLVQHAFSPRRVEAFRPRIETIAASLLDRIDPAEPCDLVATFAKPLPTIVIAEFLGIDAARHADFKRWTDALLLQGYPQPTDAQWQEIVAADAALRSYVETLVEQRRAAPRDDLTSFLIAARDHGDRLSEAEIVDLCNLLIGAGNFTTTDLIGNAVLALLRDPRWVPRLREDPARIGPIIQEALRYDSPSLIARRFVLEDIEVAGRTIAAGAVVNLVLAAANHDPATFDAPDAFDPGRPRRPNLAFGQGRHHCLGAPLARLEAEIAVAAFFNRFPEARLQHVARNRTLGFRGCRRLLLTL